MLHRSSRLRVECADQVATLWLETSANDRNTLTTAFLRELNDAIEVVRVSRAIDALVIRSAQPNSFATGPDLDEYDRLSDVQSRRHFARMGQKVLANLEGLSLNTATIAYIDGSCSNAGLELALACDFRLAVARPETRIGFDCSESGILPCWGATQRLPRLIGPHAAIDLFLRGARLPARAAQKIGLVDRSFGPRSAKTELAWFIADVQDHKQRPRPRKMWLRLRDHRLWSDAVIFQPTLKRLPAGSHLRSLVDAMRRGWQIGAPEGYAAERAAFETDALHNGSAWRRAASRQREFQAESWCNVPVPKRIGICGSNPLAVRIAVDTLAAGGSAAICTDENPAMLRRALLDAVDQGIFNALEAEQSQKRVSFQPRIDSMHDAEFVFVTGSDAMQAASLLELDRSLPPEVVLIATSSTLPLEGLATKSHWPGRIAGIAFSQESLSRIAVEVTPTKFTEERIVASLFRWLEQCGRRPTTPLPIPTAQPVAA